MVLTAIKTNGQKDSLRLGVAVVVKFVLHMAFQVFTAFCVSQFFDLANKDFLDLIRREIFRVQRLFSISHNFFSRIHAVLKSNDIFFGDSHETP